MKPLTTIGVLLLAFGIFTLYIRIIAYKYRHNKDKRSLDIGRSRITSGWNIYRILSIILILIALGILFFSDK